MVLWMGFVSLDQLPATATALAFIEDLGRSDHQRVNGNHFNPLTLMPRLELLSISNSVVSQ